jgi:ankyrin repeat protein
MYASEEGRMDTVRVLVERGADVNVEDRAGHTALFYCSSKDHDEIQPFLIPLVQQRNIGLNHDG